MQSKENTKLVGSFVFGFCWAVWQAEGLRGIYGRKAQAVCVTRLNYFKTEKYAYLGSM